MFDHFGWKSPIPGQIFRVFGFFHFITPDTESWAILCLLSHYVSKSVQRSILYVGPRKKKK